MTIGRLPPDPSLWLQVKYHEYAVNCVLLGSISLAAWHAVTGHKRDMGQTSYRCRQAGHHKLPQGLHFPRRISPIFRRPPVWLLPTQAIH